MKSTTFWSPNKTLIGEDPPSPLYLNENIHYGLVEILLGWNYKVFHTKDVGNLGKTDEEQMAYAASKDFTLLTHNREDFKKIHKEWMNNGRLHSGIIIMGQGKPEKLARRIRLFYEEVYTLLDSPFCMVPPDDLHGLKQPINFE